MKHPETILVPILMCLDYVLTILGARLADRKTNPPEEALEGQRPPADGNGRPGS
jgi:hypothetical protein